MIKATKYGTVNRGTLKRLVAEGKLLASCKYSMTDDYAWDNAVNFGAMDGYLPARLGDKHTREPGVIYFTEHDFKSSSGMAWLNDNGTVTLKVHGNESWVLKLAKEYVK